MGSHTLLFDYTFNFGSNVYNTWDANTIREENRAQKPDYEQKREDMDIDQENDDRIDRKTQEVLKKNKTFHQRKKARQNRNDPWKPKGHQRKKVSQLLISWLLCVNFREFVLSITPCPGTGEDHDHLIPILVHNIRLLLKESEYEDKFKLLKCDGYNKNSKLAEYIAQILSEMPTIHSNNGKYHYEMKEWCTKLYVMLYNIFVLNILK